MSLHLMLDDPTDTTCLACGEPSQGELVCVACDEDDYDLAERQFERRNDV